MTVVRLTPTRRVVLTAVPPGTAPLTAALHDHTWDARSAHLTGQGEVCYERCPCGWWRVLLDAAPPVRR